MTAQSTGFFNLKSKVFLRGYFALAGIEAIANAIYLLALPSDSHNNILFGYSLPRIAVLLFLGLVAVSTFLLTYSHKFNSTIGLQCEAILACGRNSRAVFIAACIATFIGLEIWFGGLTVPGSLMAYYLRLRPLMLWIILFSAQTALLIVLLRKEDLSGKTYTDRAIHFIPAFDHKILGKNLTVFFAILYLISIPRLIQEAQSADLAYRHGIATIGDDGSYHLIATNLAHGFGYSERLSLPLESYHLDLETAKGQSLEDSFNATGPEDPQGSFYRPPGLPFLLSGVYILFGNAAITARYVLVACSWGTALLILLTGFTLAGWVGALAGGLAGLYHLNYAPLINFERLMTEIPTGFWIALFCFLFILYLKRNSSTLLVLSAISLSTIIFTRANFFTALPIILIYLAVRRQSLKRLVLFTVIVLTPLVAWSIYASLNSHQIVFMTTQGPNLFAASNNIDVLAGLGPNHSNRGQWNPGYVLENGHYVNTRHNLPGPGENGWVKGLQYWGENLSMLPDLFYVKLQVGTWYDRGRSAWLSPEGMQLISVGLLLLAIGFRRPTSRRKFFTSLPSWITLLVQCTMVIALFILWNKSELWLVLMVWFLMTVIAIFLPYGDIYQTPFPWPVWFLAFVASHLMTTLIFYGVRFHLPIFTPLLFLGISGTLFGLYELFRRNLVLAMLWISIIAATIIRFALIPEIISAL